jgi:hypothetical protein
MCSNFVSSCNFNIYRIVKNTNEFFKRLRKNKYTHKRKPIPADLKDKTDEIEIRALLGLWLNLGISGFHNSSVDEIFSSSKYSSLDAHLCFSRDRYKFLMRAIRFDNKQRRFDLENLNPDGTLINKHIHIKEVILFSRIN